MTAAGASAMPAQLRIGSLNVHGFKNGKRQSTSGEIAKLLDSQNLDIIAVQEAKWQDVAALAHKLGDLFWVAARSTALLSRFPLRTSDEYGHGVGAKNLTGPDCHLGKIKRSGCETRHARAVAELPGDSLEVLSIHLDHVAETRRLAQLQQLTWHCTRAAAAGDSAPVRAAPPTSSSSGGPLSDAVWMGDFNALTRTDYDESEWREVAAVRARSDWEAPVSELTCAITGDGGLQFVDARVAAREAPGPRSTCRFNTRIDYVFLGPGTASRWRVAACEHVEAIPAASDHNLVVATLETA